MLYLDLNKQYQRIKQKIDKRLQQVIADAKFILGPEVFELEAQLALYTGAKYCLTVGNGTDALQMALMALNIQRGDEVITSAFTFAATAEAICLLGAIPVFVDIDANTYAIDPYKIAAAITENTKAILAVSLFGQCADFDKINSVNTRKIPVIEDAAQSFGATYKGRYSCNLSTVACTSFFPSKPLGCYGDGGACFTNDDELAEKLKKIRVHGQTERYHHSVLGINSRLDTLQAAILLEKLAIFPQEIIWRNELASYYGALLASEEIKIPMVNSNNTSVYAQYTIETEQRDGLRHYLAGHGVPTAIHYPNPLYQQPAFKDRCKIVGDIQHTETAARRVLSLPMHAYLEKQEIASVAERIQQYFTVTCSSV